MDQQPQLRGRPTPGASRPRGAAGGTRPAPSAPDPARNPFLRVVEWIKRLAYLPAWLAGADTRALRNAPSERTFYTALGTVTTLLAAVAAIGFTLAVAYVDDSVGHLWRIALMWFVVVVAIERLLLQMEKSSPPTLIANVVLRLLLAFVLAATVGEALALRIFEPEVQSQMQKTHATELKTAMSSADFITPRINDAKREVARLTANVGKVNTRVKLERYRSAEAAQAAGRCNATCVYYADLASADATKLASMRKRNAGRLAGLRTQIRRLQTQQRDLVKTNRAAVEADTGIAARRAALHTVQDQRAGVSWLVFLVKALLIVLDLIPIGAKVLRLVTVPDSAYLAEVRSSRKADTVGSTTRTEESKTAIARAQVAGMAQRRKDRRDAAKPDYAEVGDEVREFDPASGDGEPIDGVGLAEYSNEVADSYRTPIPIEGLYRAAAFVGLAVTGVVLAAVLATSLNGLTLAAPLHGLHVVLAIRTRGFRRAPEWTVRLTMGSAVLGAISPFLVALVNA